MIARIACWLALWGLLFASKLSAQDAVEAAVETYVRDVIIPSGYGQPLTEKPERRAIAEAIVDAEAAPVGRRQTRGDADEDKSAYQWNFKNKREQKLKLLELSIRMELQQDDYRQWKFPGFVQHYSYSEPPRENEVVQFSTVRPYKELEFEERISDDCVHAYLRHVKNEPQRIAFHGVPKSIWDAVQVNRPVTFLVVFSGTETYQSVTGERSILAAYFVDQKLFDSLVEQHMPKPQLQAEPHPKARTWTSADGRYKIEGYAANATSKAVKIVKQDGKTVEVEIAKLSKDDADWVRAFLAAQKPMKLLLEGRSYGADNLP